MTQSAAPPDSVRDTAEAVPFDRPFQRFGEWMRAAEEKEINDPNAMALATADAEGRPSLRMVLLKGWDEDGFVFYTNLDSRKGQELRANPEAALCLHWKSLRRQVRIEGPVTPVSGEEADAYFQSRARDSRIGAWASKQSQPMQGRFELERRVAQYAAKFHVGPVPRPDFWSGFRLDPRAIEFWADGAFRLHDRERYRRADEGWQVQKLFP